MEVKRAVVVDEKSKNRQIVIPCATSAIVVSTPIVKKFVSDGGHGGHHQVPEVKVIVTESPQPENLNRDEKPLRVRSRKADLSKCSTKINKIRDGGDKIDHYILLGESVEKERKSTEKLISESFSLPKFIESEDSLAIIYVKCPECGKKLKQKSYRSHLRTHLGEKQFKCDLCGDRFTRKNDVKRHKRLIHDKPRNFQCDVCHNYFLSEENLKNHKVKHNNDMKCKVCKHGFGKREYFENHIKYVHPKGRWSMAGFSDSDEDSPLPISPERELGILRKNEKRKSQTVNIPYHDVKKSKVVLLSDETLSKSVVEETQSQDHIPQKKVPTSLSSKLASNLDQLVQMNDGTFVFMKEDGAGETEDSDIDEPVQEESQDAVQTLINAVQELIQTHEATEKDEEKV